jgi:hypothetical protein
MLGLRTVMSENVFAVYKRQFGGSEYEISKKSFCINNNSIHYKNLTLIKR